MLKTAGIIVLIPGLDDHRLVEGQPALMDRFEPRLHDGDLAGVSGGGDDVAMTVGRLPCVEVFEVRAGMEGLLVAQLIKVSDKRIVHRVAPLPMLPLLSGEGWGEENMGAWAILHPSPRIILDEECCRQGYFVIVAPTS